MVKSISPKIALVILLILGGVSCKYILDDDETLTLERLRGVPLNLRLDGYYYQGNFSDGKPVSVYFFYYDGVMQYLGAYVANTPDSMEACFHNPEVLAASSVQYFWGVYQIHGDSIAFEKWAPSGGAKYVTFVSKGRILNDSTFIITETVRPTTGERRQTNKYYHFRKYSPKPDSTNSFIE